MGFLYADGAVSSKRNEVELSLQILDAMHLYKFKNFIQSKCRVYFDYTTGTLGRCRFQLCNKHFKEQLINLGCTPKKSLTLKFPDTDKLPEQYQLDFIRGYFDGDGCLSHTFCDTKKSRYTISAGLIGTPHFLKRIKEILENFNIQCRIYTRKQYTKDTVLIGFNKTNAVKFLNLIYNNPSEYLYRKYDKYLFFSKFKNFAVYVRDYVDYERAKSEKTKQEINQFFNIDIDKMYVNSEITKSNNID